MQDAQKILLAHHHCLSQGAYLYRSFSPTGVQFHYILKPMIKPNDPEQSARGEGAVTNHGSYTTKSLFVSAFASKDIYMNEEENKKQGTKATSLSSLKWEQKVRLERVRATSHCFSTKPPSSCGQMGLQGHQEMEIGEPFRDAWPVTLSLLLSDTLFSHHNRAQEPRGPGPALPHLSLADSDLLPRFSAQTPGITS